MSEENKSTPKERNTSSLQFIPAQLNPVTGQGYTPNLPIAPRRQPSDNLARGVSFPDNPVTMSQSPPKLSDSASGSEDDAPQRGRSDSRSASLPPTIVRSTEVSPLSTPGNVPRSRSVKHLTCFWWKEKGECKYSDDDCLYAHHDTGRYTEAPRQVNPNEPAKAGKNLARALSSLSITGQQVGYGYGGAMVAGSSMGSRPMTPVGGYGVRSGTPSLLARVVSPTPHHVPAEIAALQHELGFYKTMAATNQQEKNILIDMIHTLRASNVDLTDQIAQLESEKGAALRENDALKSANMYGVRTNPYGPIGAPMHTVFPHSATMGSGVFGNDNYGTQTATRRAQATSFLAPAPPTPSWRTVPRSNAAVARITSPVNTNPSGDEGDDVGASVFGGGLAGAGSGHIN